MPPGARAASAVLAIAALLLAGCAGPATGPRLAMQSLFDQSDASYAPEGGAWSVQARGRVANGGPGEARGVAVQLGVAGSCGAEPGSWAHREDLGPLVAGGGANLRAAFVQPGPRFAEPALWFRVLHAGGVADRGCGALPVG